MALVNRLAATIALCLTATGLGVAAPAQADPVGSRVCQLLAGGNTPEQVAHSTAVQSSVPGGLSEGEAMVLVRSVVAAQCPQFLWRF